jgi:hypothetical protein
MIATAASAEAAVAAPMHTLQVGNGDEDWLYDTASGEFIDAPDTNGDIATFSSTAETWFQLRQTSTYTSGGAPTFQLASNGSSHHCLQAEGGPVEVQDCAATSGQYWFFILDYVTDYYMICDYYWSVHTGGDDCMRDDGNHLYTISGYGFNYFQLAAN